MKITFLGTGTSVGVPAIGCDCPVCTSDDPRNKRLRSSIYVETDKQCILIDTTPDFRTQALTHGVKRIDALLLTHSHADHIFGFDDIRRFNTLQRGVIPVYGSPKTIMDMNRIFDYVHAEHPPGVFRPEVLFQQVTHPFEAGDAGIVPIEVSHSPATAYGYRIDANGKSIGYFPDCNDMPEESIALLRGMDVMVLDALRYKPHSTHFCVEQSVNILKDIGAAESYLIHMCHDIEHASLEESLPDSIHASFDGLTVEV